MSDPNENEGFTLVDPNGNRIDTGTDGSAEALIDRGYATVSNPSQEVLVRVRDRNNNFELRRMPFQEYNRIRQDALRDLDTESIQLINGNAELGRITSRDMMARADRLNQQNLAENYGGTAFANAAANFFSFGASGALQEEIAPGSAEAAAEIAAANPTETNTALLMSAIGSLLMPGSGLAGASRLGVRTVTGGRALRSAGLLRNTQAGATATRNLLRGLGTTVARETAENLALAVQFETAAAAVQNRELSAEQILANAGIGTVLGVGATGVGRLVSHGFRRGRSLVTQGRRELRNVVRTEQRVAREAAERAQREFDSLAGPNSRQIGGNLRSLDDNLQRLSSVVNSSYDDLYQGIPVQGNVETVRTQVATLLGDSQTPAIRSLQRGLSRSSNITDVHKQLFDARRAALQAEDVVTAAQINRILDDPGVFGVSASNINKVRQTIMDADVGFSDVRNILRNGPEEVIRKMSREELESTLSSVPKLEEAIRTLEAAGNTSSVVRSARETVDSLNSSLSTRNSIFNEAGENLRKAIERASTPRQRIVDQAAENLIFTKKFSDALPTASLGALAGGPQGALAARILQTAFGPRGLLGNITKLRGIFVSFERQIIKHNKQLAQILKSGERLSFKASQAPKAASPTIAALRIKDKRNETIEDLRGQVSALLTEPGVLVDTLTTAAIPISGIDEGIGDLFQTRSVLALQYLDQQFPQVELDPLNPSSQAAPLSNSEADAFADTYEALENPMSVYSNLLNGTLSNNAVEAVRTVYPEIYTEMQRNITAVMVDHLAEGQQIPYQLNVQISSAFGIETDPTLSPEFLLNAQSIGVQTTEQAEVQGLRGPRRGSGTDIASFQFTQAQRIEFEK